MILKIAISLVLLVAPRIEAKSYLCGEKSPADHLLDEVETLERSLQDELKKAQDRPEFQNDSGVQNIFEDARKWTAFFVNVRELLRQESQQPDLSLAQRKSLQELAKLEPDEEPDEEGDEEAVTDLPTKLEKYPQILKLRSLAQDYLQKLQTISETLLTWANLRRYCSNG